MVVNGATWTDTNSDFCIILCLEWCKFLDNSVILNLACSGRNRDSEKFTGKTIRKSDTQHAGVETFTPKKSTEKFEKLIGRKFSLAVKYNDEFSFYRHRCY